MYYAGGDSPDLDKQTLHHRHWPLTPTSFCLFPGQYNDWLFISSGAGSEGGNLGAGTPLFLSCREDDGHSDPACLPKQSSIFQTKKCVLLGETPSVAQKHWSRLHKEATEDTYADKNCPFNGNGPIRGRTAAVRRDCLTSTSAMALRSLTRTRLCTCSHLRDAQIATLSPREHGVLKDTKAAGPMQQFLKF